MSSRSSHSFTQLDSYKLLQEHAKSCKNLHMRRLFSIDPQRHEKMSLKFDWLLLDYSKNCITDKTLSLLFQLAREAKLDHAIQSMFQGQTSNQTENHPALHTALRNCSNSPVLVDGSDVMPEIDQLLKRMTAFTEQLHRGDYLGYNGQTFTDIVNIGIGGSSMGPQSMCKALTPYHQIPALKMHFVTNIDGAQIQETLSQLDPATTLFIISSKSFKNAETLANASVAKHWLLEAAKSADIQNHLLAVTDNELSAESFGIRKDNIFQLWDWLDYRYAAWSAVGLPVMLSIGTRHFMDFLQGAHEMDQHFFQSDFEKNMPVIMALIGIWYNNFMGAETHAILPYDHNLAELPRHIEQLDMQSTGRSVDNLGRAIEYSTGPIIWGGNGLHNQHAFYQLLHRGKKIIPADFIVSMRTHSIHQEQHDRLFANAVAQTEVLMRGRNLNETLNVVGKESTDSKSSEQSIPHRVFDGNNPSNMLLLERLTPKSLGILLALYEHKTFTQGILWNINPFDQWGVKLSNTLSHKILQELHMPKCTNQHDTSTNTLIKHYRKMVYPHRARDGITL